LPTVAVPEDRLADAEAARRRTLLDAAEWQNEERREAESEKLDDYVDDLERAFEAEIKVRRGRDQRGAQSTAQG
jgi:hypothetical protein